VAVTPPPTFPDPQTLAVIERFSLWLRRSGRLHVRGRPTRRGAPTGLDFLGYAPYRPGMDLRHVDWQIYARTGELQVRKFADESAGLLGVLVDASGSMAVGGKWAQARAIAAALVHAALAELHEVLVGVAQGPTLEALPSSGGLSFAPAAFGLLRAAVPGGPTNLGSALAELPVQGGRGDAVIISDFLDPLGAARALEAVHAQGFRVDLVRITAPGEFELPHHGVLRDPESDDHRTTPSGTDRARALARLQAHQAALVRAAKEAEAVLVTIDAQTPLPVALTTFFEAITARRGGGR
jgi:uncharacterized protein (DUF58 family)